VDHYDVATSRRPITEASFDRADDLPDAAASAQPGDLETYTPPAGARRYVAIRAVDEQGNVGRAVSIQIGAS
jgi:hypothetical protein